MTACNPRVIHIDGRWQAWCKPCGWESPWTTTYPLAVTWRDAHAGLDRAPAGWADDRD